MYCTTCGKELAEGAAICPHCGFKVGVGNKHCSHCGVAVQIGQSLCVNCGFMLTAEDSSDIPSKEKQSKKDKTEYKKYENRVKKTKLLNMIMQVLSVLLVLSLIFLPIYTYAYSPQSMDELGELEDLDQWEELLEEGTINKNFSLWNDFTIILTNLLSENSDTMVKLMAMVMGMFAIFEVIFAAVFICTSIAQIIKNVHEINEIDKTTLLTYTNIKKTGSESKKEKVFKKQTAIVIVLYALFDVIFAKLGAEMYKMMPSDIKAEATRNMISLTGVSPFIWVVIILLIGYFVLKALIKTEEVNLSVDIAKEEIED